ncbi:MAG: hypothetical protein ABR599_08465 [Gemmatimonadota bacterium]
MSFAPALTIPQIVLEELGEMAGATTLLWATWELARSHGVRLVTEPVSGSPPELPGPAREGS